MKYITAFASLLISSWCYGNDFVTRIEVTDQNMVEAVVTSEPGRLLIPQFSEDLQTWNDVLAQPLYSFGGDVALQLLQLADPSGGNTGGGGNNPPGISKELVSLHLKSITDAVNVFGAPRTLITPSIGATGAGEFESLDFTGAPPIFVFESVDFQYLVAISTAAWEPQFENLG